jgi:hypothetical protein
LFVEAVEGFVDRIAECLERGRRLHGPIIVRVHDILRESRCVNPDDWPRSPLSICSCGG